MCCVVWCVVVLCVHRLSVFLCVLFLALCHGRELLKDATFPAMSYFEGRKFGDTISQLLGPTVQIEDLWIQYFCVTTNVSTADMCVHKVRAFLRRLRSRNPILRSCPARDRVDVSQRCLWVVGCVVFPRPAVCGWQCGPA